MALSASLLLASCAIQNRNPSIAEIEAANAAGALGVVWVILARDADGQDYALLQRDLQNSTSFSPQLWVRRTSNRGQVARIHEFLWAFDCRARTARRLAEKAIRSDGSSGTTVAISETMLPPLIQEVSGLLIERACSRAGMPPTREFD